LSFSWAKRVDLFVLFWVLYSSQRGGKLYR
jgi:hypothetical protein